MKRQPPVATPAPKILRDDRGREVIRFTTPSGVTAWIDTSISDTVLAALARKLERRIRRRKARAT